MGIFESPCFNTRQFKNRRVLKNGDFVRPNRSYFSIFLFQYTEIQKSPCIKHGNFLISVFQCSEIQKYPCIELPCKKQVDFFFKGLQLRENATAG